MFSCICLSLAPRTQGKAVRVVQSWGLGLIKSTTQRLRICDGDWWLVTVLRSGSPRHFLIKIFLEMYQEGWGRTCNQTLWFSRRFLLSCHVSPISDYPQLLNNFYDIFKMFKGHINSQSSAYVWFVWHPPHRHLPHKTFTTPGAN